MSDRYLDLVNSGIGRTLATRLGLPRPTPLRRYAVGQPVLDGPALVAGVGEAPLLAAVKRALARGAVDVVEAGAGPGQATGRLGAVVLRLGTIVVNLPGGEICPRSNPAP